LDIINLRQRPSAAALLARWHYQEWQVLYPDDTEESFKRDLEKSLTDENVPSTWLLTEGENIIGSCSIIEQDMDIHPELSPWLANVFIHADYRGQGLGSRIIQAVMKQAAASGLDRLYLFTEDQAEFYQRFGWQVIEQPLYNGIAVSLMTISLKNTAVKPGSAD